MIEWTDKFSVDVSIIDEEHKTLIDIFNKAIIAYEHNDNIEETKDILNDMIEYTSMHFLTEESYMLKSKFPEYQSHRNEHLDFTNKTIMSYHDLISGDNQKANKVLDYLKQWLAYHIQVTDKQYIDYFKKNGLK